MTKIISAADRADCADRKKIKSKIDAFLAASLLKREIINTSPAKPLVAQSFKKNKNSRFIREIRANLRLKFFLPDCLVTK